jgi:NADH-quinone oxidoreductase subunit E
VPLLVPWLGKSGGKPVKATPTKPAAAEPAKTAPKKAAAVQKAPTKPQGLTAARDGKADDLKQIKGIGPKLEKLCNSLGFYHYDQIANWAAAEIEWVDENLAGFKGRVTRDTWVQQAKILATGGETDFSKRVDKGEVY